MAPATLNPVKDSPIEEDYPSLLYSHKPQVIQDEKGYIEAMDLIEKLMRKDHRTGDEQKLLDLLFVLVENYEKTSQRLDSLDGDPHKMLRFLLKTRGCKQANLVGVIGSKGVVSEIVNGKRGISKAQAKALGDFFDVSPLLFI